MIASWVAWLSFLAPQVQQPTACCTGQNNGEEACIGAWEGPYELQISCAPGSLPGSDCGKCSTVEFDEIGHAALIPAGPYAGHVLFWTGCDFPAENDSTREYSTHIWNPATPTVPPTVHPPIANIISNHSTVKTDDGPFCSGHVWILDALEKPKLLAIGGNDRKVQPGETPCKAYTGLAFIGPPLDPTKQWPSSCGANKAYWFDPDPPGGPPAWSEVLPDLPHGLWYPSVITYLANRRFHPVVLGGSGVWFEGCDISPEGIYHQYQERWIMPAFTQPSWATIANPGYSWHQYPRSTLLHDGRILVAGSTVICESPAPADAPPLAAPFGPERAAFNNASEYGNAPAQGGQNPVRLISASGATLTEGIDPNDASTNVGGWHYCNSVLLHTLKDKYENFDPGYPGVPGEFENLYDLDRVIVMGGVKEERDVSGITPPALQVVREHRVDGTWQPKELAPTGRQYGNAMVLPDGTILSVGGQNQTGVDSEGKPIIAYRDGAEQFNPQLPQSLGSWKTLASRPTAFGATVVTPRAYHSVAMLLKSGYVVLMGGRRDKDVKDLQGQEVNTLDTVEIYHPSYTYCTQRPQITSTTPLAEMHYGSPYQIKVNKESRVDYACLIGVSSITHHFDYGQRYVELMVRNEQGTPANDGYLQVLPPTESAASMAPEGYYMLFVVDIRDNYPIQEKIPSVQGEFVKLTFGP